MGVRDLPCGSRAQLTDATENPECQAAGGEWVCETCHAVRALSSQTRRKTQSVRLQVANGCARPAMRFARSAHRRDGKPRVSGCRWRMGVRDLPCGSRAQLTDATENP